MDKIFTTNVKGDKAVITVYGLSKESDNSFQLVSREYKGSRPRKKELCCRTEEEARACVNKAIDEKIAKLQEVRNNVEIVDVFPVAVTE